MSPDDPGRMPTGLKIALAFPIILVVGLVAGQLLGIAVGVIGPA
jgi:hypothetical protein